jgi:hypothetical protein
MQTPREGWHEVVRLREQLPVESPDAIVIAKAQQLDAILLIFEWGFFGYCDLSASRLPGDYPLCGGTSNAFPWIDWSRTPSRSSAFPTPSARLSGCAGRVIHCVSHALPCRCRRGHRPCSRESEGVSRPRACDCDGSTASTVASLAPSRQRHRPWPLACSCASVARGRVDLQRRRRSWGWARATGTATAAARVGVRMRWRRSL